LSPVSGSVNSPSSAGRRQRGHQHPDDPVHLLPRPRGQPLPGRGQQLVQDPLLLLRHDGRRPVACALLPGRFVVMEPCLGSISVSWRCSSSWLPGSVRCGCGRDMETTLLQLHLSQPPHAPVPRLTLERRTRQRPRQQSRLEPTTHLPSRASPTCGTAVEGFTYLRHETFSCGGQTHTVAVYRCEAFARAIGLKEGETAVDAEFTLIPECPRVSESPPDTRAPSSDADSRRALRRAGLEPGLVTSTMG
jgi:hypothetical protein